MEAKDLLKKHFGYEQFRPLQKDIVEHVLSGKDALVLMPTGGGKSICFQLPALMLPGVTLVISPLISLMKDQVDALKANGIAAEFINSSLSAEEENNITRACEEGKVKLVYMSPERAVAWLNRFVAHLPISLIAIDEAHCVSNWGHDFRPEYKELFKLRELHPNAVMMALTATADKLTRADMLQMLGLRDSASFVSSFDRPNISLTVKFGFSQKEKLRDIGYFIQRHQDEAGIIYCTSKKSTEVVADALNAMGIAARFYHAGMPADARNEVQEAFINDQVQVVCATIAFGMGIDKSNVRWVVHYNLPKSIENYYQEIGRGGRDGSPCDTVLYYNLSDAITLREFALQSGQPEINVEKLQRMQEYAESRICRRKILLNYFGENLRDNCGNCDVCKNPPKHFDGTRVAQMALSAVVRMERASSGSGTTLLIDVLRGSHNQEVLQRGLQELKTYGAGRDHSFKAWTYYLTQMVQIGMLEIDYANNKHLRITPFGNMVLMGKVTVDLVEPMDTDFKVQKGVRKVTASPMVNEPEDLFTKLKQLRRDIAMQEGKPPYIIFHDTTLHEMVERMPVTEDELLEVSGMSDSKMERYGQRFLEVILHASGKVAQPRASIDELLNAASIGKYLSEMQQVGISARATSLAHLLMGSALAGKESESASLAWFGSLRHRLKYGEVLDRVKPKISALMKATDVTDEARLKAAKEMFDGEKYRRYTPADEQRLRMLIARIAIVKKPENFGTERMREMRAQFPRHQEPWYEEEKKLLNEALRLTNDEDVLSNWFGRSPNSMRAMGAQMKLADEVKLEP